MTTGTVKPFLAQRFASFLTQGELAPAAPPTFTTFIAENPAESYRSSEGMEAAEAGPGPFWDQGEVQAVTAETPAPSGPSEVDLQIAALLARTECELSAQRCEMTRSQLDAGQKVVDRAAQTSDSLHTTSSFTPTPSSSHGGGGYAPAGGPSLGYMAPGGYGSTPGPYGNPTSGLASMGYRPASANGFHSRY